MVRNFIPVDLTSLRAVCAACSLRELCLPTGLSSEDMQRLDSIITRRQRVNTGEHLYRVRDGFHALHAIRRGSFKTYEVTSGGAEQVNGFHMTGELLGLDGIGAAQHTCNAVALDDGEVCEIPFPQLEGLLAEIPSLMHQFHRLMSREIAADHEMMLVLGTMSVEQRLAAFLINLSDRLRSRGLPHLKMQLTMSREDIGNYLGMKIETVSRTFSKFQTDGLLTINRRDVTLVDHGALQRLAGCADT